MVGTVGGSVTTGGVAKDMSPWAQGSKWAKPLTLFALQKLYGA